jgi:hypothetical protein
VLRPAATAVDWSVLKGDSFDLVLAVLDASNVAVDVTGWTAKAQVRRSAADPLLYEWSAAEGNLTISGDEVTLNVIGADTAAWGWSAARISVEVTDPDGKPSTIAYGTIRALDEITQ